MNRFMTACVAVSLTAPTVAAPPIVVPQPVQVGDETGRYRNGIPISVLERKAGAVSVIPMPMDHGSFAFQVVVYNDSEAAANFDTSNIKAEIGGETLRPFTADELASAAKSRAMWSQIGVALLAGAAAAATANAYTTNTYSGRVYTPHGAYSWVSSYRDNSVGQVAAAASVAGGVVGIASIQGRLNATLDMIGDSTVQRTTVDPASSYGGKIVIQKPKVKDMRDIRLTFDWNGEQYQFAYHLPKKGEAPPMALRAPAGGDRLARAAAAQPAIAPVTDTTPKPALCIENAANCGGPKSIEAEKVAPTSA